MSQIQVSDVILGQDNARAFRGNDIAFGLTGDVRFSGPTDAKGKFREGALTLESCDQNEPESRSASTQLK